MPFKGKQRNPFTTMEEVCRYLEDRTLIDVDLDKRAPAEVRVTEFTDYGSTVSGQQSVLGSSSTLENDFLVVPGGVPAFNFQNPELNCQPPVSGSFLTVPPANGIPRPRSASDSQYQEARRLALRELRDLQDESDPMAWPGRNRRSTNTVGPSLQLPRGTAPIFFDNNTNLGRPIQQAAPPYMAFPIPVMRRPPLTQFLVATGDVKRVEIKCTRGHDHVCAKFQLEKEHGSIDSSLAHTLKLEARPLLPQVPGYQEAPWPKKYVELTLVGMESVPGARSTWPTRLFMYVNHANRSGKIILGWAAARALGLQADGAGFGAGFGVVGDGDGDGDGGTGLGCPYIAQPYV
jgi:hypothetical protein